MKTIKIYMAGPLFTEADQAQRKLEETAIGNKLYQMNRDGIDFKWEIFNPITQPINDKSTLPSAEDIYKADAKALMEADIVVACLDGEDAGVMYELGMVQGTDAKVVPYLTDMRVSTAGAYDGIRVPFGYNQFVVGALSNSTGTVYRKFSDSLDGLSFFVEEILEDL